MKRSALTWMLFGVLGCATQSPAPPSQTVRRIAVLPARGPGDAGEAATAPAPWAPSLSVGDVLTADARMLLAEKGFEVIDPMRLAAATNGVVPESPQMAAHIVADAHLDATAMYIHVRVWQATSEGMRTDAVIVALDVMLVDPATGQIVWEIRRAPKPVPLYATALTGQANVFVAETVMREVLAPLGVERKRYSAGACGCWKPS